MSRNTFLAKLINKLHRAYWFIVRPHTKGVKVLIFNAEDKILMVRLTYYPDTWTFPGGGIDSKELPQTAAKREVKEEVEIELPEINFVAKLNFDHEYKKDTVFIFRTDVQNVDLKNDSKEIAESGWFSLNALPHMGKNAQKILETVG